MLMIWPFLKPAWTSWFMVHVLLKPGLKNFEHYFTSMWDECNCAVVWTIFGIAFLWDWNENWPFPILWPLLSFPNCWHIDCSIFTVTYFRIWNSSTGIPSPPLALFIVMLPKTYLTSHCLTHFVSAQVNKLQHAVPVQQGYVKLQPTMENITHP